MVERTFGACACWVGGSVESGRVAGRWSVAEWRVGGVWQSGGRLGVKEDWWVSEKLLTRPVRKPKTGG
eukprot:366379-Chlamydomonas_euryale.AAC.4